MSTRKYYYLSITAGLVVVAVLIWMTAAKPPAQELILPGLVFCALIVFTMTFGIPLGGGLASLLPMTMIAAYLVIGPLAAGWAAMLGAFLNSAIRYRWSERLGLPVETGFLPLLNLAVTNGSIQTLSVLGAAFVYREAGGTVPMTGFTPGDAPALVLLGLTYLSFNFVLAGAHLMLTDRARWRLYLRSLINLVVFEAYPLVFAPLMALVYTRLGLGQFFLFGLAIVFFSLSIHGLIQARARLERRVSELDGLQAIGQALSASLDLETILETIYLQVAKLMPAANFYVALYDSDRDEVAFPLVFEQGERVHWRTRRMGDGLTEYILRTSQALLITSGTHIARQRLGLSQTGRPAASFLGVPVVAGEEPLGVIAVQSYSKPEEYDTSHEEVLVAIASQAAVAIQNARLYARTDQSLERRIQELNSILETVKEGILLLDLDWRILAANRTFAKMFDLPAEALAGKIGDSYREEQVSALLVAIGYTVADLGRDCEKLLDGEIEFKRQAIVPPRYPESHLERTLAPVRSRQGAIIGWLFVFRDFSEEVELAKVRDEMTHMLIHDLRSPLSTLQGSLNVIEEHLAEDKHEAIPLLVEVAQRSSARLLRLTGELLDINRFEGGQMPLSLAVVDVEPFLKEIVAQYTPVATRREIEFEQIIAPDLPRLTVDSEHIVRVLQNLLDNAFKFTSSGGRVTLWANVDSQELPRSIRIGVKDTGPGISPQDQARLFKKYQQITPGNRLGTGLGLLFCKLAIEAHAGKIWVESEVGKGSNFIFSLPAIVNLIE